MSFSLIAKLGLDTKDVQASLMSAERSVDRFQSVMGKVGIAVGAMTITRFFMGVVQTARTATGELDENTAAVQRFARGLDALSARAEAVGMSVVGSLNRMGEAMGDSLSRALGASDEQLAQARRSAEAAAIAVERLAEARSRHAAAANEAARLAERNLDAEERLRLSVLSTIERQADAEDRLKRVREAMARLPQGANPGGETQLKREQLRAEELAILTEISQIETRANQERERAVEQARARVDELIEAYRIERLSNAERLAEIEVQRSAARERAQAMATEKNGRAESLLAQERLLRLTRERDNILAKMREDERRETEQRKRMEEEMARKRTEREQSILSLMRQQRDTVAELTDRQRSIIRDAQSAFRERSTVSLTDLASGQFGRGPASDARRIMALEDRARQARVRGNDREADRLTREALERRRRIPGLSDFERDPGAVFRDALEDTNRAITDGNTRIEEELRLLRTQPL